MLQALLHGKLSRQQENMEDLLTSNVFGLMEYLHADKELLRFLGKASHVDKSDGTESLSGLLPADTEKIRYEFWPRWTEDRCIGCEPDLVLRIDPKQGEEYLVLVEAKYHSGKSSVADEDSEIEAPPKDQLAREWDNLIVVAEREGRTPVLIYLTADIGCPQDSILKSLEDHSRNCRFKKRKPFKCYWLSWRHLAETLQPPGNGVFENLLKVMQKLNLVFFHGISEIPSREPREWSFSSFFDWSVIQERRDCAWRFTT